MSAPQQGEAIAVRIFGPYDASHVAAYAAASGDDNPLHTDASLAAKAGLAQPPIHGMLMMACLDTYLRDWRPDVTIAKLTAKFLRPILIGEMFEVSGKVVQAAAEEPAVLRLTVKRDGTKRELVGLAEAFVTS